MVLKISGSRMGQKLLERKTKDPDFPVLYW